MNKRLPLEPLEITCTSTACDNGLHCFLATKKMREENKGGRCRNCGIELIDWERVHRNDLNDVEFIFSSLRKELFRHYFWHVEIDELAISYAKRKGHIGLREATEKTIRRSVASAHPFRDGCQTPREGSPNPVHYAQHATASCCRRCIEAWHNIPRGRELTEEEVTYLSELAYRYLLERLPTLSKEGEHVPKRRRVDPRVEE